MSDTETSAVAPVGGLERWRDRVAVVTGASSGIGRALCARLVAEGLRVAACARRSDRLEALADEFRAGDRFLARAVDLRDEAALLAFFRAVRERWGGVDVLVNNAGLGREAPLADAATATADWREMLEVNVLALCVATREAVADMRARGDRGHVIHIGSMAGHRVPGGASGVYAATKFAVRALTEGLRQGARQAGSAVRVTMISLGFVETEFATVYAHGDPAAASRTYGRFPVLTPDDIAGAAVFALGQPDHVEVHDVLVRPTRQPT